MSWAHYCSNLTAGPQLWHNTHIHNEGLPVPGRFYYKRKCTSILGRGGKTEKSIFLAKPCIIDLISLVAAAFGLPFQWAALFCLAVDASQISSLVKQAFVQVPHKNDWFGFYQELWHFSTTSKNCICREVYQDGNSDTNIFNVLQNPLPSPQEASLGRNFSHSGISASWKEPASLWDCPALSPAAGGR